MKILKFFLIVILFYTCSALKADELDKRNNITKNLRCLVCQGQSIYDSDSEFANSLKILVDRKIDEGLTDAEIYEYFKNKYGEWILYDPKLNIIGMNYKDNLKNAENFLKELGNPYKEIFIDLDGTIAIEWGAYGVPESFLIYNNEIIKKYIGPLNQELIDEVNLLIK